jgi:hypothetical protein
VLMTAPPYSPVTGRRPVSDCCCPGRPKMHSLRLRQHIIPE